MFHMRLVIKKKENPKADSIATFSFLELSEYISSLVVLYSNIGVHIDVFIISERKDWYASESAAAASREEELIFFLVAAVKKNGRGHPDDDDEIELAVNFLYAPGVVVIVYIVVDGLSSEVKHIFPLWLLTPWP